MMSDLELDPTKDQQNEIVIALRFRNTNVPPYDITAALGIAPKVAYSKGERRRLKNGLGVVGRSFEHTFWTAELVRATSPPYSLSGEIEALVDRLEPHAALFARVTADGGQAEFFIGWFVKSMSGLTLPTGLMSRLVALGIELDFDVYSDHD